MIKLTKAEARVLQAARDIGVPFAPTTIGMRLGYEQTRASSRVALQLKSLTGHGLLVRSGNGKSTNYSVAG